MTRDAAALKLALDQLCSLSHHCLSLAYVVFILHIDLDMQQQCIKPLVICRYIIKEMRVEIFDRNFEGLRPWYQHLMAKAL